MGLLVRGRDGTNSQKSTKEQQQFIMEGSLSRGFETPCSKQLGWDLSLPSSLASGVPASRLEEAWLRVPCAGLNPAYPGICC